VGAAGMTADDILTIVIGLLVGYWLVSKLFFRTPKPGQGNTDPVVQAPPQERQPQWNDILQVAPSATAMEIRVAYKQLISKYHPDKVDSLGQEIKDVAAHKSADITAAYREGMRVRGFDP
jgi:DnaJ domain